MIDSSFSALFLSPAHWYSFDAFWPAFSIMPVVSFLASQPMNFRINLKYGAMSNEASPTSNQPKGTNGNIMQANPTIKIKKAIAGIMNFFTELRY